MVFLHLQDVHTCTQAVCTGVLSWQPRDRLVITSLRFSGPVCPPTAELTYLINMDRPLVRTYAHTHTHVRLYIQVHMDMLRDSLHMWTKLLIPPKDTCIHYTYTLILIIGVDSDLLWVPRYDWLLQWDVGVAERAQEGVLRQVADMQIRQQRAPQGWTGGFRAKKK